MRADEDAKLGQIMSRERRPTFSLVGWAKERSDVPTIRGVLVMVGTLAAHRVERLYA